MIFVKKGSIRCCFFGFNSLIVGDPTRPAAWGRGGSGLRAWFLAYSRKPAMLPVNRRCRAGCPHPAERDNMRIGTGGTGNPSTTRKRFVVILRPQAEESIRSRFRKILRALRALRMTFGTLFRFREKIAKPAVLW